MTITSKIRSYGTDLLIWVLALPTFLLILFPLMSATSPGTSHVHLVSVLWNSETDAWLRIGYYGICLTRTTSSICSTTSFASAQNIADRWGTTDAESVAGIEFALKLQNSVFVAFLTAGGLSWLLSLVLSIYLVSRRGGAGARMGRMMRVIAKGAAVVAALLVFASAWATGSAAKALEVVLGRAEAEMGSLLVALQWIAAVLVAVHAWAVAKVADREARVGDKARGDGYYMARQWGS